MNYATNNKLRLATLVWAFVGILACCSSNWAQRSDRDQAFVPKKQKIWRPKVVLSDEHAKTCLLKVGGTFPATQLPDLKGANHSIQANLAAFNVVVFWNSERLFSREQFRRLQKDIVTPCTKKGVNVVAINVGDQPAKVRELTDKYAAKCHVLLDSDSAIWKQVATGDVPRTFLIDSKGKVLWFDIEYSKGAMRNLINAIDYHMQPKE